MSPRRSRYTFEAPKGDDPEEVSTMRRHLIAHGEGRISQTLEGLRAQHRGIHPHFWHTGSCNEARCGWRDADARD